MGERFELLVHGHGTVQWPPFISSFDQLGERGNLKKAKMTVVRQCTYTTLSKWAGLNSAGLNTLKNLQDCTLSKFRRTVQCSVYTLCKIQQDWTVNSLRISQDFQNTPGLYSVYSQNSAELFTFKILQGYTLSKFCGAIHSQNSAELYTFKILQSSTL